MLNGKKLGSILATVYILLSGVCLAQKVTLVNSSERHWAGGIAGRTGVNYTFSIRFEGFEHEPRPDTIWIGDEPVKILLEAPSLNTRVTRSKKSIQYNIMAGTMHDEYARMQPPYPGRKDQQERKPHRPISYNGIALLSYNIEGTRQYYVISKIMHTYEPVSYP